MANYAERLWVIQEALDGLFVRLYSTKKLFENDSKRPSSFDVVDKTNSKILGPILKKFPQVPPELEKGQLADFWKQKAPAILEEVEPFYHLLVDLYEFRTGCYDLLKEISNNSTSLKWGENSSYVSAFLDACCGFMRLHVLLSLIPLNDRRLMASLYSHAYRALKGSAEPSYNKVVTYVQEFEAERKKLIELFIPFAGRLGETLASIQMPYEHIHQTSQLRKEGAISLIVNPEKITYPIQDPVQFDLQKGADFVQWILFVSLFAPDCLSTAATLNLLKSALSNVYMVSIFRDELLNVHNEFEALFASYKSAMVNLGKQKKIIAEATKNALTNVGLSHKERRVFLRQEMQSLKNLLSDKPGLMGPKFQIVLAALSCSREEILFFLSHQPERCPPPKGKVQPKDDDFKDPQISHLIHLHMELYKLAEKYKRVVQAYYLEYVGTIDYTRCFNEWQTVRGDKEFDNRFSMLMDSMIERFADTKPVMIDSIHPQSFMDIRLNWLRAEITFSLASFPHRLNTVLPLVQKMKMAVVHTQLIDTFDTELQKYGSLGCLAFYLEDVKAVFVDAVGLGLGQPAYVRSLFDIAVQLPLVAHPSVPQEKETISKECTSMCGQFLQSIALRVGNFVEEMAGEGGHMALMNQTSSLQAALRVNYAAQQARLIEEKDKKKKSTKAVGAEATEPAVAGMESYESNRAQLNSLRSWMTTIAQICSSLQKVGEFVVSDVKFNPLRYVYETLEVNFKKVISASVVYQDDLCRERFSTSLGKISHYVLVMKYLDSFCDMSVDGIVREVFLGHFYDRSLCSEEEKEQLMGIVETPAVESIAKWFGQFVTKRLSVPGTIIYSPTRRAMISQKALQPNEKFKAEDFIDFVECKALATLVGPYGIKLIDQEILKAVTTNLLVIKDNISDNKQVLQEFSKVFPREAPYMECIKKMKGLDALVNNTVFVGSAMALRSLLYSSLSEAMKERLPVAHEVVKTAHEQYRTSIFTQPHFVAHEQMAAECGILYNNVDPMLKETITSTMHSSPDDGSLWELLPFAYAATFLSPVWKDVAYKSGYDAHSNNAHCMVSAIEALVINLQSLALKGQAGDERKIAGALQKFVEFSSIILLKLNNEGTQSKELPSMFIFLDKFVQKSRLLTMNVLENCVPYALLRSLYLQLYDVMGEQKHGKNKKDAGEEKGEPEDN